MSVRLDRCICWREVNPRCPFHGILPDDEMAMARVRDLFRVTRPKPPATNNTEATNG